jgi:AcrR family transcriptional regulator
MLEAAGYPDMEGALTRVAEHLGVPLSTIHRWFHKKQNPPPSQLVNEKRFDLVEAIKAEIANAFQEMSAARDQASYKDLTTAAAILIDKLQLLSGEPTARTETITRWLDELPQDEYDAVIAEAERIIQGSSGGDFTG